MNEIEVEPEEQEVLNRAELVGTLVLILKRFYLIRFACEMEIG